MTTQNGAQMTKFFDMNDNSCMKKTAIFQKTRQKFAVLQEMDFERNEKKVRELLDSDRELFQFPIPLFMPTLLIWLFMIISRWS